MLTQMLCKFDKISLFYIMQTNLNASQVNSINESGTTISGPLMSFYKAIILLVSPNHSFYVALNSIKCNVGAVYFSQYGPYIVVSLGLDEINKPKAARIIWIAFSAAACSFPLKTHKCVLVTSLCVFCFSGECVFQ